MAFDQPSQLCQGKFTIKDEELRTSIVISFRLKGVVNPLQATLKTLLLPGGDSAYEMGVDARRLA